MMTEGPRTTIQDLQAKKQRKEKITRVVLWDYPMALLADAAGVDMILVGDSVGMCMLGYENTLPVTMDEMIHHCKAVVRGRKHALIVGDLPFMSYETGVGDAVRSAGRLLKEGGVDAVKIEGGSSIAESVRAISRAGIPVHGHIGLTPQKIMQLGGFKVQGKTLQSAMELYQDACTLAEAGCFAVTLECTPPILGELISERLKDVIVLSAGAGPGCDGQSINLYDIIGLTPGKTPRFTKRYARVAELVSKSVAEYCRETREGIFPAPEHCYDVDEATRTAISEAISEID
jgi:3-methyl-2-oxobutanoate hydroxymethyltransferase